MTYIVIINPNYTKLNTYLLEYSFNIRNTLFMNTYDIYFLNLTGL